MLTDMNQEGGFPIAVLTDVDGFTIASAAAADQDSERQSAVVAVVQRTALQVQDRLGMSETEEFSMFDKDGKRLICRLFTATGHAMILAVLVPNKDLTYRRLMTRTVNAIRILLKD
jgi:predicted regulator of Ras-like GTPase activity (Roadblock/LC7/MglB family)